MERTINFNLSKRLNELLLLDNIETEYKICEDGKIINDLQNELLYTFDNVHRYTKFYKTLTLEEAIEFLPYSIKEYTLEIYKCMNGNYNITYVNNQTRGGCISDRLCMFHGPLIGGIEKMIEYLLDNNLLTK